jgi:hypothetical protein
MDRRDMAKRKLTVDEMTRLREWAREREHRNHPGASIQIIVKEETDEDDNLVYSAVISREYVVSRSDIPL